MVSLVKDLKDGVTHFETAAKKRKDVGDLTAAMKKIGDVEKYAKAWDKAYTAENAESLRTATSDLKNAIKVASARFGAVVLKLQRDGKDDASGVGASFISALNGMPYVAEHYLGEILSDAKHAATKNKMQTTQFSGQWVGAKRDFEVRVGKKKPSKRFLGIIRESSGLEKATKLLDAASKANNRDAFQKGLTLFKASATKYAQSVLAEAKVAVDEDDTEVAPEDANPFEYGEASKDLLRTLNSIRVEAEQILGN